MTSSASTGSCADLLGVALAVADDGEVAAVELLAERPYGRLDGVRIGGGPLGECRVAAAIHANET